MVGGGAHPTNLLLILLSLIACNDINDAVIARQQHWSGKRPPEAEFSSGWQDFTSGWINVCWQFRIQHCRWENVPLSWHNSLAGHEVIRFDHLDTSGNPKKGLCLNLPYTWILFRSGDMFSMLRIQSNFPHVCFNKRIPSSPGLVSGTMKLGYLTNAKSHLWCISVF